MRSGPTTGSARPANARDFLAFINELNATWMCAAERLSPRVLTDLYARAGNDLADFIETLPLDGDAIFPVSWAGEARSAAWLDSGREFTEVWHHGSQIRDAVGAGPFPDAGWLQAVLGIAMHALPHAYRDVAGRGGVSVVIHVTGRATGAWTLAHDGRTWDIAEGAVANPAAVATMPDQVAWRLLFNALSSREAHGLIRLDGDAALAEPLLQARAVIV